MNLPEAFSQFRPDPLWDILQIMPPNGWEWLSCWGDSAESLQLEWQPVVGWALVRTYDLGAESYECAVLPLVWVDRGCWTWPEFRKVILSGNEVARLAAPGTRAEMEAAARQEWAHKMASLKAVTEEEATA
jgi:hypothetical protein